MAGFIQNIIWNSVEGFVEAGTRTAGEYAGNALIKAGDLIESSGRGVGNGIERRATAYGGAISGQTYQPSPKPLPSTARKPAIKRSNSSPASSKPAASGLGASKYPGVKQINGVAGPAKKAAVKEAAGAKNASTIAVGGASRTAGGLVSGGTSALTKSTGSLKGPSSMPRSLPKPYPNTNNLPTPYSANTFPASGRKTAVRPGQPKPFTPPVEKKVEQRRPYPGTSTLPGQGSRTPVKSQSYKPLPRLGAQVKEGQKMQHIAI